jgi:hypothetical protein
MARNNNTEQATSAELTGGAGFTFEDRVVAYYLAALLREEGASGQNGIVTSVAVQQAPDRPMDDVVVEFAEEGIRRTLGLQVKRPVRISAANTDFREIMTAAVATRRKAEFQVDADAYGFAAERVAVERLQSLHRLIDWAKSSPTGDGFTRRVEMAGAAERNLREELRPLIGAASVDDEADFYRHFVALRMDGLAEDAIQRAEAINRLRELLVDSDDGHARLLFDRLCQIARDGAASRRKWTRQSLLAQPSYNNPRLRILARPVVRWLPFVASHSPLIAQHTRYRLRGIRLTKLVQKATSG